MSKRWLLLLLAGVLFTFGLAAADDPPPGQEEAPVRLKKKNKPAGEEKPKAEPGKPAEKKEPPKKQDAPEAVPAKEPEPEIDEQEVLNRIARTMRSVQKKLAKPDLDDSLRQSQEDIVKDLESLIRNQENSQQDQDNQQNQGGGGENQNDKDKSKAQQGKQGQQEQQAGKQGKSGRQQGKQQGRQSSRRQRRQQASGRQPMGGQPGQMQPSQQQAGKQGQGGNQPGAGKDSPRGPNVNADLYKDVWGHLPEALRAEMNAYSNPEPFLAKYDDLIRKYYRTIAEQGRKKGD